MNPILRNILAVLGGLFLGSVVNMCIIMISGSVIPLPEGADMTTMEGVKAAMAMLEPKHFVMPLLAHALGTLVGAFIAAKIAASHKMTFAYTIGGLFFIGGIINVLMLGAPMLMNVLDLTLAYFPMAFIGGRIAGGNRK